MDATQLALRLTMNNLGVQLQNALVHKGFSVAIKLGTEIEGHYDGWIAWTSIRQKEIRRTIFFRIEGENVVWRSAAGEEPGDVLATFAPNSTFKDHVISNAKIKSYLAS